MKISKIPVFLVAMSLVLGAAVVIAQDMPEHMHMHRHGMFGEMLPFHVIDLTDAQRTQIKQLYENAKPAMKPLFEQLRQNHQAMIQLVTSGNFDQARAQALAAQSSQLVSQLEMQRASIASQAYQLLTPQQRTQMSQALAERQQNFERWMQQKQSEASPESDQ